MRLVVNGVRKNRDTQGRCQKFCYPSRAKAVKSRKRHNRGVCAVYFHRDCGAWHLSSER